MTRKEKIAVSLPKDLVAAAKRAVRAGRAPNVSAYVAEALEEKVGREDFDALLDQMLEEAGGPMTRTESDRVERNFRETRRR